MKVRPSVKKNMPPVQGDPAQGWFFELSAKTPGTSSARARAGDVLWRELQVLICLVANVWTLRSPISMASAVLRPLQILSTTGVNWERNIDDLSADEVNEIRKELEQNYRWKATTSVARSLPISSASWTSAASVACVTVAACPCTVSAPTPMRVPARVPVAVWWARRSRAHSFSREFSQIEGNIMADPRKWSRKEKRRTCPWALPTSRLRSTIPSSPLRTLAATPSAGPLPARAVSRVPASPPLRCPGCCRNCRPQGSGQRHAHRGCVCEGPRLRS